MSEEKEQKKSKGVVFLLIGIVALLTGFSGYTGYKAFVESPENLRVVDNKRSEQKSRGDRLQADADRVSKILEQIGSSSVDSLVGDFKEQKAENERLSAKAAELKAKIAEFMSIAETSDPETAKNYYRQIKTELFRLRVQVRKLKKRNQELIAENAQLKEDNQRLGVDLTNEKANNASLSEKSSKLQAQVNIGKRLKAFDMVTEGIKVKRNGKEKVTNRAKRAQKIRVAFTISKNELTSAGQKTVYLRVVGPNDQVLTDGGSSFTYKSEELAFTSSTSVNYNNESKDVVMYAKNYFSDKFEGGTYKALIYCEDALLGTTQVSLK